MPEGAFLHRGILYKCLRAPVHVLMLCNVVRGFVSLKRSVF